MILLHDVGVAVRSELGSRRPQWRGDRKAVMVRLPVAVEEQLRGEAVARGLSMSDAAGVLITEGLGRGEEVRWPR